MKHVLKSQLNSIVCSTLRWESKPNFASSHQARSAVGGSHPEHLRIKIEREAQVPAAAAP